MKKVYVILIALLVTVTGWSQVKRTWTGGSGSWASGGNWTPSGVPAANDTVVFNVGASALISNVMSTTSITVGKLVVMGNSSITLSNTSNSRTLTVANGVGTDLTIESGSSLTLGTGASGVNITLGTNTSAAVDGTLVISTNRTYDGNNSGNSTNVTGVIQNSGTVNSTTSTLAFASGSTYIHQINGGTVPTATWNVNSTCELSGLNSAYPAGMGQTFGNVLFNSNLTADVELSSDLDCAGNLTISNTGAAGNDLRGTNSNTNRVITVDKKFKLTSGTFVLDHDNGGSELDVAGDFEITGGTLTEDGSGTAAVTFDGNTTQLYTKSGGTISGTLNFTINANAIVDFGTSVLNGSAGTFTLTGAGKMITSNAAGIPATITVSGTKLYSSVADYEFKGAITGVFTTSPTAATARNITINNSSSFVTLSQPMTVTGVLSLQNGELHTTSTNLISVSTSGSANATNSSFVVGPVQKIGSSDFEFPTGRSGSGLIPIKISGLSGVGNFTAEHKASPATTAGATITASGLKRVSGCEYWMLTRVGAVTANVTMYWNAFSNCNSAAYVTDLSTIVVAHSNGVSWDSFKNDGGTSGDAISGTVTWNNVSVFSPFALGSTSIASNPLPVLFDNVRAFEKGTGVQIEWSNLTERDLVSYTIERSVNGSDYSDISTILPKSNHNDKADYIQLDATPARGINFYRIRVLGMDGKLIYSKILKVETGNVKQSFGLYPNPLSGSQVTVALSGIKAGQFNVKVINSAGQEIFQKVILSQGSSISQTLQLPSAVKPGIYTMLINGDSYTGSKHFVVQ